MYKFYWNNLPKSHAATGGGQSSQQEEGEEVHDTAVEKEEEEEGDTTTGRRDIADQMEFSRDFAAAREREKVPELPVRSHNQGVTVVRVRDQVLEGGDHLHQEKPSSPLSKRKNKNSSVAASSVNANGGGGSHRVLLRLRRISSGGGGRPKSISDAGEIEDVKTESSNNKETASSKKKLNTMKSSRSMHHFQYNKTWNERSLSKFSDYFSGAESFHDYENVYSGQSLQDNDYEDYEEEEIFGGNGSNRPVHVDQVSCNSATSRTSRRRQFLLSIVRQGRKASKDRSAENNGLPPQHPNSHHPGCGHLYRSKSCERPKMKEAIRGMQQNINRLSSNLADRVTNRLQQHQQQQRLDRRRRKRQQHQQQQQQQLNQMSHSISSCALSSSSSNNTESNTTFPPLSIETGEITSFCHIMQSHGNLQDASASPSNFPEADCSSSSYSGTSSSAAVAATTSINCSRYNEAEEKQSLRSFNSTLSRSDAGSTFSGVTADPTPAGQKIRGIQKKISRLRSRSVERISQRSQMVRERLQQLQLQRQESANNSTANQPLSNSTAQLMIPTAPRSGGHILPTPLPNRHASISGEEEQDDGSGSQSSVVDAAEEISYQGRARALVDYTPSPYDRDALKFKRGDHINIISMNPSGLWKGRTRDGRVGNFKFINVEVLRSDESKDRRRRRSRRNSLSSHGSRKQDEMGGEDEEQEEEEPSTVEQLLRKHDLQTYLSVFVLNGYEEIVNLQDMTDADLDYLGIKDPEHRERILELASLIKMQQEEEDDSVCGDDTNGGDDTDVEDSSLLLRRLSFPRDSGCFTSANSSSTNSTSSGVIVNHPALNTVHSQLQSATSPRLSPSTSERSSSSSSTSSSHPESGIGIRRAPRQSSTLRSSNATNSSEDSDTIVSSSASPIAAPLADRQLIQRSAEQAAKTRSRAKEDFLASDGKFEQLVQKYASAQSERRASPGFHSARSLFEQRAAENSKNATSNPSSANSSPKKVPTIATAATMSPQK